MHGITISSFTNDLLLDMEKNKEEEEGISRYQPIGSPVTTEMTTPRNKTTYSRLGFSNGAKNANPLGYFKGLQGLLGTFLK